MIKARGFDCYTIGFDYGPKHNSELKAAYRIAEAIGDHPHKVIRLDLGSIGGSALTGDDVDVPVEGGQVGFLSDLCSGTKYRVSLNRSWVW